MNPTKYTLLSPVVFPTPSPRASAAAASTSCPVAFIDIAEVNGDFVLYARELDDWPAVTHRTTGKRGRLVRAITNQIVDIPSLGKTTLTLEWCIVVDGSSEIHAPWPESEWCV